jgi:hypothetical protein
MTFVRWVKDTIRPWSYYLVISLAVILIVY